MDNNIDLLLVKVDSKYCDYLRKFDMRVPYNYGKKDTRPFIGVLFIIDDCKYFAPISSPKPKHKKMRENIDFLRIDKGNLGAINFNNMIPVTDNNIEIVDLNKKYRSIEKIKYNNLLKKQLYWLNRNKNKLYSKSKRLYNNYIKEKLDENIYNRCCDFKLLEIK